MNNSTTNSSSIKTSYQNFEMNYYYAICEILVAMFAVVGNALVIFVFRKDRRLRRRTNYYIVSLAVADLLVGLLGIPFAILASIGLPTNLHACLFTVSTLVVLCTISIFCLVAVSVDRYWAILYPMGYSRNVRTKTAIVIISICWVAGGIVGFLPLLGWHQDAPSDGRCFFLDVMDYNYLVFLYFGTIITPAVLLAASYAHIYRVVLKQLRRIVTMNPSANGSSSSSGGTMLRMLGAAQKREVKATQNLAIIVFFFMICWIPLYTINCVLAFCRTCHVNSTFMLFCIILSHLNSAGNPLLYAYHLKDFRAALKNFFCNMFGYTQHTNNQQNRTTNNNQHYNSKIYSGSLVRRKSNELQMAPRISTILKSSATLAAAATGDMWNIPEGSDSSDEQHKDRMAMVRPATPYRPHSQVNQAFIETSSGDDECDDVFADETFPFTEFNVIDEAEDTLAEAVRWITTNSSSNMSNSSPQLSKNLFFIEQDVNRPERFSRSISCVGSGEYEQFRPPLELVRKIFRDKHVFTRSLSENVEVTDEVLPNGNAISIRSSLGC